MTISALIRNATWNKYVGIDKLHSVCFCCGKENISNLNFLCGYVIGEKKKGKATVENLRPVCKKCNKSIGTKNIDKFMTKHKYSKNENWNGLPNKIIASTPINEKKSDPNEIIASTPTDEKKSDPIQIDQRSLAMVKINNFLTTVKKLDSLAQDNIVENKEIELKNKVAEYKKNDSDNNFMNIDVLLSHSQYKSSLFEKNNPLFKAYYDHWFVNISDEFYNCMTNSDVIKIINEVF